MENPVHTKSFVFNKKDNGGEAVMLEIRYYDNGDTDESGIFMNQTLTLQSYGNSASFELCGSPFTPDSLREVANLIESGHTTAISKALQRKKDNQVLQQWRYQ